MRHSHVPSRLLADIGPYMRHAARTDERITRPHTHALLGDFENVFTLHNVEPFPLRVMQMAWRTTFTLADLLDDEQAVVRILRCHLEGHFVGARDCVGMFEAIGAMFHVNGPRPLVQTKAVRDRMWMRVV